MPHMWKGNGLWPLVMAIPKRNANKAQILSPSRTFFATAKTSMGRALLQSERNAMLLIDVLRFYVAAGRFQLQDFVIMPDHVHLLITVSGDGTIERAMQFIKGGLSYRLRRELGYLGEVWQSGFSELRVEDRESYVRHREYIAQNPVKARLVDSPEKFPYCFTYLARRKPARKDVPQGLKPDVFPSFAARLKSCPDTKQSFSAACKLARGLDACN
jgi:putative transposase